MTEYASSDSDIQSSSDNAAANGSPKHESAERIFRLLQFLIANECTRQEIFEHLASYYKIEAVVPGVPAVSRSANRMFERDITFLEEQGFEVKKVRRQGQPARHSIVKGTGPRTTFLFTESEYELFIGNKSNGSGQRRGRFTVPIADLSASTLVCHNFFIYPIYSGYQTLLPNYTLKQERLPYRS